MDTATQTPTARVRTPAQIARAEIRQLAAAAADMLARDRLASLPKAQRGDGNVWAVEIDALAAGLAAPALQAVDALALVNHNIVALLAAVAED